MSFFLFVSENLNNISIFYQYCPKEFIFFIRALLLLFFSFYLEVFLIIIGNEHLLFQNIWLSDNHNLAIYPHEKAHHTEDAGSTLAQHEASIGWTFHVCGVPPQIINEIGGCILTQWSVTPGPWRIEWTVSIYPTGCLYNMCSLCEQMKRYSVSAITSLVQPSMAAVLQNHL